MPTCLMMSVFGKLKQRGHHVANLDPLGIKIEEEYKKYTRNLQQELSPEEYRRHYIMSE